MKKDLPQQINELLAETKGFVLAYTDSNGRNQLLFAGETKQLTEIMQVFVANNQEVQDKFKQTVIPAPKLN